MATLKISGVSEEQVAAWDAARGYESFASWARRVLDAAALDAAGHSTDSGQAVEAGASALVPPGPVASSAEGGGVAEERGAAPAGVGARRKGMCEHRVPAGSWCKKCGSI